MNEQSTCALCGHPMPEGEEMFNYHGYSGPCPEPSLLNNGQCAHGQLGRACLLCEMRDENLALTAKLAKAEQSNHRLHNKVAEYRTERDALRAEVARLKEELHTAEWALTSKGYRKACSIPACNCGDQWNHGGHANDRLYEFCEVLRDAMPEFNGKTLLTLLNELVQARESAENRLRELRRDYTRCISDLKEWGAFGTEINDNEHVLNEVVAEHRAALVKSGEPK